jgi:hypothetical protein
MENLRGADKFGRSDRSAFDKSATDKTMCAKPQAGRYQVILNNFSAAFLANLQPLRTKEILIGLVILLVVFAAFASVSTKALANGDAAIYLQQMRALNFTDRPVHIGYYLLGAGFVRIFPGSDDRAINLMNCFLGAGIAMLIYFVTFTICHKHIPAVISSLLFFTHKLFLENSIYAEVYTPQVCFLLLSILMWLLDRPVLAGLSFLLSFLITPSTILALPCFFILRPRLRPLLLFCAIFSVSAVVVFPVRQLYFFGARGLFVVTNRPFNIRWALSKEGREIFSGFFLCIPLIAAGLLEIFGRKRFRPVAFAILILWLVTLFLAEKIDDVSPQLPVYAMLCIVGGFGFGRLLGVSGSGSAGRLITSLVVVAVIVAIFMNGVNAFRKILTLNKSRTEYRNAALLISRVAEPGYLVLGGWSRGILFEHYVFRKSSTPHCINLEWLDGSWGKDKQDESVKRLKTAIASRRQIWLLGEYEITMASLRRNGYKITLFNADRLDTEGDVVAIYVAKPRK